MNGQAGHQGQAGLKPHLACLAALLLLVMLGGCQSGTSREVLPIPELTVAVASFSQPANTPQLLAGALPENINLAPPQAVQRLNDLLRASLDPQKRPYIFLPEQDYLNPLQRDKRGKRSSLSTWTWHAQQAQAPIILVPQIIQWQSAPGEADTDQHNSPTTLDFFLIDAREQGLLLQRLKFEYPNLYAEDLYRQIQADLGQVVKEFGL